MQFKEGHQKHAKITSNPSLYKTPYLSEQKSITRSIFKFISGIYFSIEISIKEKSAKNGGHLNPGNTCSEAKDIDM